MISETQIKKEMRNDSIQALYIRSQEECLWQTDVEVIHPATSSVCSCS